MTRIANLSIAAALAASLACAPAAEAKQSKSGASTLKSKCTVAAVVFGTGWDIFGGSSSCSMLQDRAKVDAEAATRQAQAIAPVKNGKKS
ncbi:MAG: hypothetical protein WBL74_00930 [Novosphingobium sp.]|uniref:hypothetical protein n=1 Tax=Novosphingobium sp. TaxID=1874826 RepID=UPI003C7A56EB